MLRKVNRHVQVSSTEARVCGSIGRRSITAYCQSEARKKTRKGILIIRKQIKIDFASMEE